ncbi:MAG: hypothetical protein ACON5A_01295 [Candidatus Comchoanobacterales bacterium]
MLVCDVPDAQPVDEVVELCVTDQVELQWQTQALPVEQTFGEIFNEQYSKPYPGAVVTHHITLDNALPRVFQWRYIPQDPNQKKIIKTAALFPESHSKCQTVKACSVVNFAKKNFS